MLGRLGSRPVTQRHGVVPAALAASLGPAGGVGLAGGVAARPAVSGIPGSVFGATGVFPVGARGFRLLAGAAGGLLEGGHIQFLLALDETLRVVEVLFGRQQVGMGPERIPRLVSPRLSQAAPDRAGLPRPARPQFEADQGGEGVLGGATG